MDFVEDIFNAIFNAGERIVDYFKNKRNRKLIKPEMFDEIEWYKTNDIDMVAYFGLVEVWVLPDDDLNMYIIKGYIGEQYKTSGFIFLSDFAPFVILYLYERLMLSVSNKGLFHRITNHYPDIYPDIYPDKQCPDSTDLG
jgi:hypothetical protein